jgi:hypothetical protein
MGIEKRAEMPPVEPYFSLLESVWFAWSKKSEKLERAAKHLSSADSTD